MKKAAAVAFLARILSLCTCLPALPLPLKSAVSPSLGNCERFRLGSLGSWIVPGSSGLVAEQLLHEVQLVYLQYYTMDLPLVRILEAVITCESFGAIRGKSNSVSVLVKYRCSGRACLHGDEMTGLAVDYTHHFSFQCDITNTYRAWNATFTNRMISYDISKAEVFPRGQCALCIVNSIPETLRYQETAGCIGNNYYCDTKKVIILLCMY